MHTRKISMSIQKLGRYQIVSEVGKGAMGTVYKAIDPLIERTVAIKAINLDLSKDELASFEERFYREAKSAGQLSHPNIVTIYDIGETDNVAYIAMEFLEGQSLRELLDSGAVLAIDRISRIAAQVAEGLAYAQKHGIVHRDIKPANIVITRSGVVKITDFGIAHMPSASRTQAGMVLGSPKYMSPEQVVGKTVDGRSDIFSLGVMLYEMLTGQSPFAGDNISTIMYRILNETPLNPSIVNARIPLAFDTIITKALAKRPEDRYQTAKEMARDLKNYPSLNAGALVRQIYPKNDLDKSASDKIPRDRSAPLFPDDPITVLETPALTSKQTAHSPQTLTPSTRRNYMLYGGIAVLGTAFILTVWLGKNNGDRFTVSQPLHNSISRSNPPAIAQNESTPSPPPMGPVLDESGKQPAVKLQPETITPLLEKPAVTVAPINKPPDKLDDNSFPKESVATPNPDFAESKTQTSAAIGNESTLQFAVTPWGEIYVDGVKAGIAPPLKELKVTAGKHTIEIRNLNFSPYSETLELRANSIKKIKYKFN